MASPDIDELFAHSTTGDYRDEPAREAVSALRRGGTREGFDRAAAWCKSDNPVERSRGADILAQLGTTIEHPSSAFPEDSYAAMCQMLRSETEIQPLSSGIHALGHLNNPKAIPLISS